MRALAIAVALLLATCAARAFVTGAETHVLVVVAETDEAFLPQIVAVFPGAADCEVARVIAAGVVDGRDWRGVIGYGLACVQVRPVGPKT